MKWKLFFQLLVAGILFYLLLLLGVYLSYYCSTPSDFSSSAVNESFICFGFFALNPRSGRAQYFKPLNIIAYEPSKN